MTIKMPQFVRELKRFREVAAAGESIVVEDQAGQRFIFALAPQKQHPPRQADRGLDPKQFADIDLDEPTVPSSLWEANR